MRRTTTFTSDSVLASTFLFNAHFIRAVPDLTRSDPHSSLAVQAPVPSFPALEGDDIGLEGDQLAQDDDSEEIEIEIDEAVDVAARSFIGEEEKRPRSVQHNGAAYHVS